MKGQIRCGTKRYSESFKKKVVDDIVSGKFTMAEAIRYYDIRGRYRLIQQWLKKFGIPYEFVYTHSIESEPQMSKESNQKSSGRRVPKLQSEEDLKNRIKELESELEKAELKAQFYEKMIEIAERELKIPIRKKSSTK